MENNNLNFNYTRPLTEQERGLADLILDMGNFMASQPEQLTQLQAICNNLQTRLKGKPYSKHDNLDYLLAISG